MTPQQQQALQHLRQLLASPAADPAEIAATYVAVISEQLLQFARQAHERDGAGLVEIDLRGINLRTARGMAPITYYPAGSESDEWPPNLDEVLDGYDPAREAVVLLFQDGAGPQIYILG
ncbi:MAG: hypothetical protein HGA45_38105 [Chloroflexales bacterium]|nr:hypothetical protein [Chloroflexales bacterium]